MLYYLLSIILIVIDQMVKLWIRANIPLGFVLKSSESRTAFKRFWPLLGKPKQYPAGQAKK